MTQPIRFLHALAHAVATMTLYREGHPARERAVDHADEALRRMLETTPLAQFTFLPEEVVCGIEPLRELAKWSFARRLNGAGIQRLEFEPDVSRDDLEDFLDEVAARLTLAAVNSAELRQMRGTRIRFGAVGLEGMPQDPIIEVPAELGEDQSNLDYTLVDEADSWRWLLEQVELKQLLHVSEAETLIRSLTVAMHGDRQMLIPLLRLREYDEYTTTHALNVAVLAMAFAEFLGLSSRDVRAFGVAGLLHDIGKVRVPREILFKPGPLTPEERSLIARHTTDGALMILEMEQQLELAAIVAYEHHMRADGGGYPERRYGRGCHYASRVIHICDVYDALRTRRPYRDAWDAPLVLAYITEHAGTEFDAELATAFVRMMGQWEGRIARVTEQGAVVGREGIHIDGRAA